MLCKNAILVVPLSIMSPAGLTNAILVVVLLIVSPELLNLCTVTNQISTWPWCLSLQHLAVMLAHADINVKFDAFVSHNIIKLKHFTIHITCRSQH